MAWNWIYPIGWESKSYEGRLPYLVDDQGVEVLDFGDCTEFYPNAGDVPSASVRAKIAAVPELYAALVGLKYPDHPDEPLARFCDHAIEPCDRCEAARAALAKADGTNP